MTRKMIYTFGLTEIGVILGLSACATLGSLRSTKELVANALRSIRRRQSCKVPGSTRAPELW
jgi:hypothetical protein